MRIEAISAVPDAITSVYVSVLRVHNRLRSAALLNLGMAGLMLILAWILLPVIGIAAVPVAVLVGEGSGSLAAGLDVLRVRRRRLRQAVAVTAIDADIDDTGSEDTVKVRSMRGHAVAAIAIDADIDDTGSEDTIKIRSMRSTMQGD